MGLLQDRLSNQVNSNNVVDMPEINIHVEKIPERQTKKESTSNPKRIQEKVEEPEEMTEETLLAYQLKKSHDEKEKIRKSKIKEV